MRLAPPKRLAAPIVALISVVALAGCGSNKVVVQEVPGEPAQLTVPGSGSSLAPSVTPTPTAEATDTPDAADTQSTTPNTDQAQGTSDQTQTNADGTTGGTETPNTDDSATTDQPPPAGSPADKFEDFCAESPGAC